MNDGYTARKRRAMRNARRDAVRRGLSLLPFRAGPTELGALPDQWYAVDRRDRGWVLLTYDDGEFSYLIRTR